MNPVAQWNAERNVNVKRRTRPVTQPGTGGEHGRILP